ncbi:grasp-with-spasm system SPASM domain peptide maturase [Flavobacteriaceae bacterium M23B6Z8]
MKLNINQKFELFSTCIPIKGALRSIIYDLNRETFDYIPNALFDILDEYSGKKIKEVLDDFHKDNYEILMEYFDFLVEKEYIFFNDFETESFPDFPLHHNSPFQISNIIIDVGDFTFKLLPSIYQQLEELGVEAVCFRFPNKNVHDKYFYKVLDVFCKSSCRTIEIMTVDNDLEEEQSFIEKYDEICLKNQRIFRIHLFNAPKTKWYKLKKSVSHLFAYTNDLNLKSGHVVDRRNFAVNIKFFVEAQNHNVYYNRKVYIDEEGAIKQSPDCKETKLTSFGNISNTRLNSVLNMKDFKEVWNVNKNDIKICKDCEYRYMCTDSRMPIKEENSDFYFFESDCNYDPFTATWKT